MLKKILSHPTSLSTTASPSLPSWTPSRPSHAEATQPRDVSSLRTPWTRLRCHPSPITPACQPWSTTRVCCCVKRPTGLGACTARPHCLLGAPRKSRPAWPGSMAEGNSEGQGGGWDAALSEQLAQPFQVYKAGPPQEAREAWHSGENHASLRSTAVNLCVAMYRGRSSMRVVASLFILFLRFHFYGFSFLFLCAVDASFLLSSRPRGAIWRYCTDRLALQLCRVWGRSPGPPSRVEMHRRMEIALGTSSFAVWTEELMVVFRDCVDHVDYMSQVDKGTTSRFAQMPAHLPPSIQEYATEGLAGRTCQLRHVTWPNCMPRAHCQASTRQSCPPAVLDFSLHRFYFCPFAPFHSQYTSCPTGTPLANGSAEVISHPLGLEWACGTRGTTPATFLPGPRSPCVETSWYRSEADVWQGPEILRFQKWPESLSSSS